MGSGILIEVDPTTRAFARDGWVIGPQKFRLAMRWPELGSIELYLSREQQVDGGTIDGKKLFHELRDRVHVDISYFDYLLANPHLIPISWSAEYFGRPLHIFFVGTTYLNPKTNHEFARCLRCIDRRWSEGYAAVSSDWHCNHAVAVVKQDGKIT